MVGRNLDRILDIINFTNPDSIDKEQIKGMLAFDRTWDSQVLDSLYFRNIFTIEEYKFYLGKYIERLKERLRFEEEYLKEAEEKGDNYNPYTHYGFGIPSYGGVIDALKNNNFQNVREAKGENK